MKGTFFFTTAKKCIIFLFTYRHVGIIYYNFLSQYIKSIFISELHSATGESHSNERAHRNHHGNLTVNKRRV